MDCCQRIAARGLPRERLFAVCSSARVSGASMQALRWRAIRAAPFAAVLVCIAGCNRDEPPPAAPEAGPAQFDPATPAPSSPVTPAPSTDTVAPESSAAGPASGGSAIGGVAGGEQQDDAGKDDAGKGDAGKGDAGKGDAPAPTGGDGAPQPESGSKQ